MIQNITLPFVTKTANQTQDLSYQAEITCVVCLAESQRKKPGFLRDASEKIGFISKIYYPLWILPAETAYIIIDGLSTSSHHFTFGEPTKTAAFVEELKKNFTNPEKFTEALKLQAKETKEFTSPKNQTFPGVIDDRELLTFLAEYFKVGAIQGNQQTAVIPTEVDANVAAETSQALVNCIRTMQADAKGLTYALAVLKEELEFHTKAAANEVEWLEEKRGLETAALKPAVDKAVKKITQKQNKSLAALQKSSERKLSALEKKREKYLRKLQVVEQRKDAVQKRVDSAKKKKGSKSSSGSFALQKYGRDVENTKREIKAISEELDKLKKETENSLKAKRIEFQNAVAQEENQITQLTNAYNAKTTEKQNRTEEIHIHAATITTSLESKIDDLKRSCNALRIQVEVNLPPYDQEEPVLAQLPIYLVKYVKADEERYNLLSPIALSEETGVFNGLKKMLTLNPEPKLKTSTHPASKKLQETLSASVVDKLRADATFRVKVNELCRGSNLVDLNSFGQILTEGLDEIEKRGLMSREEASAMCRHVMGETA